MKDKKEDKRLKKMKMIIFNLIFVIAFLFVIVISLIVQMQRIQEDERKVVEDFKWCISQWQDALTNFVICESDNTGDSPYIYPSNPPKHYPEENGTLMIP